MPPKNSKTPRAPPRKRVNPPEPNETANEEPQNKRVTRSTRQTVLSTKPTGSGAGPRRKLAPPKRQAPPAEEIQDEIEDEGADGGQGHKSNTQNGAAGSTQSKGRSGDDREAPATRKKRLPKVCDSLVTCTFQYMLISFSATARQTFQAHRSPRRGRL